MIPGQLVVILATENPRFGPLPDVYFYRWLFKGCLKNSNIKMGPRRRGDTYYLDTNIYEHESGWSGRKKKEREREKWY